ncbi:MAG: FkbM family methyltransferase [Cryomorphaceae bacterium]
MDIGANIGCYTLIAAKLVGSRGKVYAFEPVSNVHERLKFNIGLNGFKNVTAEKKAVYESKGQLKLYVSSAENTGMSGIFHRAGMSGKIENVEAVKLDEYITAHGIKRLDAVKIDIEGSEFYALKGMEKTLAELKPVLIIEISDGVLENSPIQSTDIIDFLESRNYIRKAIGLDGAPLEVTDSASVNYHNYAFFPKG